MDIKKYFKKSNDKLSCAKFFCSMLFHFFSALSCKRDEQCARGTRSQKEKTKFTQEGEKGRGFLRMKTWRSRNQEMGFKEVPRLHL